jgi:hypothetical protein
MPVQTDGLIVDIPLPPGTVSLRDGDTVTVRKPPDPAFSRC